MRERGCGSPEEVSALATRAISRNCGPHALPGAKIGDAEVSCIERRRARIAVRA